MYPQLDDEVKAKLPPGSFLTASSDDTIRVWNLETSIPENTAFKRNIYSNVSLDILHLLLLDCCKTLRFCVHANKLVVSSFFFFFVTLNVAELSLCLALNLTLSTLWVEKVKIIIG